MVVCSCISPWCLFFNLLSIIVIWLLRILCSPWFNKIDGIIFFEKYIYYDYSKNMMLHVTVKVLNEHVVGLFWVIVSSAIIFFLRNSSCGYSVKDQFSCWLSSLDTSVILKISFQDITHKIVHMKHISQFYVMKPAIVYYIILDDLRQ